MACVGVCWSVLECVGVVDQVVYMQVGVAVRCQQLVVEPNVYVGCASVVVQHMRQR
jgi:hypothetical protein